MNNFRETVFVFYPFGHNGSPIDFGHAHNEFLQVALDIGLLGLIGFLSIYIVAYLMILKLWKTYHLQYTSTPECTVNKITLLGLAGGLTTHLLYGFFDAIALGAKPGFIFWMLLGLITSKFMQAYLPSSALPTST